ncbi:MAG: peptide chain release factor 2 [bacterium]|nr:peptide chain release factor 2 [bacterium]
MSIEHLKSHIQDVRERAETLRGYFDWEQRQNKLEELEFQTAQESFWQQPAEEQTKTLKQVSALKDELERFGRIGQLVEDAASALELLEMEEDPSLAQEAESNLKEADQLMRAFELNHLLSGPNDKASAVLMVNSGAGGTESMDWASMLMRMYQRWAEDQNMSVQLLDFQAGEEAGIKSATLAIEGEYAFGKLKAEMGVHRLVRISPFDSAKRRHTSFASVAVYPDLDDDIEVDIVESDLRIDTYRASGAGGQHVNTTDSAVRITHVPTGIVVQCQNERSQHKNRSTAMKILKSALYEREQHKREEEAAKEHGEKKKIEWGSQVRSYVLHPYQLVKDHRTDYETSAASKVLDGALNGFIEATLNYMAETEGAAD